MKKNTNLQKKKNKRYEQILNLNVNKFSYVKIHTIGEEKNRSVSLIDLLYRIVKLFSINSCPVYLCDANILCVNINKSSLSHETGRHKPK